MKEQNESMDEFTFGNPFLIYKAELPFMTGSQKKRTVSLSKSDIIPLAFTTGSIQEQEFTFLPKYLIAEG